MPTNSYRTQRMLNQLQTQVPTQQPSQLQQKAKALTTPKTFLGSTPSTGLQAPQMEAQVIYTDPTGKTWGTKGAYDRAMAAQGPSVNNVLKPATETNTFGVQPPSPQLDIESLNQARISQGSTQTKESILQQIAALQEQLKQLG